MFTLIIVLSSCNNTISVVNDDESVPVYLGIQMDKSSFDIDEDIEINFIIGQYYSNQERTSSIVGIQVEIEIVDYYASASDRTTIYYEYYLGTDFITDDNICERTTCDKGFTLEYNFKNVEFTKGAVKITYTETSYTELFIDGETVREDELYHQLTVYFEIENGNIKFTELP